MENAAVNKASVVFKELVAMKSAASMFDEIFGPDCDALTLDPISAHRDWVEKETFALQNMQALKPLIDALESFQLKHPNRSPSQWLEATDKRRRQLEEESRTVRSKLERHQSELTAHLTDLGEELTTVGICHPDYVEAMEADRALKTQCQRKFDLNQTDLCKAKGELQRLAPQITEAALDCLDAQRRYQKKLWRL